MKLNLIAVLFFVFVVSSCSNSTSSKQVDLQSATSMDDKTFAVCIASGDAKDSVGIGIFQWSPKEGTLTPIMNDSTLSSVSYFEVYPEKNILYSVGEKISAFQIDEKTGALSMINQVIHSGSGTCHVSISNNRKFITVAYYSSGSASTYELLDDGSIGAMVSTVHHEGASINAERQEAPHVHMAFSAPNSDLILLPDLGIDQVKVYQSDEKGVLSPAPIPFAAITPGGGPRHVAFNAAGNRVYVLHELTGHVTGFGFDPEKGITDAINTISILPEDFTAFNKSADIHISPNGKFLYASNRGHNSLAVCSIDEATGTLTFLGTKDCGGEYPRAFAIDPSGDYLLVANKLSNQVSIMKIDHATGFFEKTGEVATPIVPQCIRFVELKK
jgi:6-phosphogluconolactonase